MAKRGGDVLRTRYETLQKNPARRASPRGEMGGKGNVPRRPVGLSLGLDGTDGRTPKGAQDRRVSLP